MSFAVVDAMIGGRVQQDVRPQLRERGASPGVIGHIEFVPGERPDTMRL